MQAILDNIIQNVPHSYPKCTWFWLSKTYRIQPDHTATYGFGYMS